MSQHEGAPAPILEDETLLLVAPETAPEATEAERVEPVDETAVVPVVTSEAVEAAGDGQPEEPAAPEAPKRARRARAPKEAAEETPVVVEAVETPEEVAEETPEEATAETVAAGGLRAFLSARRADLANWAQGRADNKQRAELAREHIAYEHELAAEAAGRLKPGSSREELRDMVETIRGERAAVEAQKQVEAKKVSDLAEATRLESEATTLDEAVRHDVAPIYAQHLARYNAAVSVAEDAWSNMQSALQARDEYQAQAAERRERATQLRAQYEEVAAPAAA